MFHCQEDAVSRVETTAYYVFEAKQPAIHHSQWRPIAIREIIGWGNWSAHPRRLLQLQPRRMGQIYFNDVLAFEDADTAQEAWCDLSRLEQRHKLRLVRRDEMVTRTVIMQCD